MSATFMHTKRQQNPSIHFLTLIQRRVAVAAGFAGCFRPASHQQRSPAPLGEPWSVSQDM